MTRDGRVHLTADRYARAFTYLKLQSSGDLDVMALGKTVGARILVPRYAKPSPKLPVSLELDGPLAGDYRVEVGVDRSGMKEEFQDVNLSGYLISQAHETQLPLEDVGANWPKQKSGEVGRELPRHFE